MQMSLKGKTRRHRKKEKRANKLLRKHWLWLAYCPKLSKRYWRVLNHSRLSNIMEPWLFLCTPPADRVAAMKLVTWWHIAECCLYISHFLSPFPLPFGEKCHLLLLPHSCKIFVSEYNHTFDCQGHYGNWQSIIRLLDACCCLEQTQEVVYSATAH